MLPAQAATRTPAPTCTADPKKSFDADRIRLIKQIALCLVVLSTALVVCSLGLSGHLSSAVVGWTCFGTTGLFFVVDISYNILEKNWSVLSSDIVLASIFLTLSALCATGILSTTVFCWLIIAPTIVAFPCCSCAGSSVICCPEIFCPENHGGKQVKPADSSDQSEREKDTQPDTPLPFYERVPPVLAFFIQRPTDQRSTENCVEEIPSAKDVD